MSAEQVGGRGWLEAREVGSVFGIRILLALATAFGRLPVRLVLYAIALYYTLTHRLARAASRDYLRRMGLPSDFRAVFRHVMCFAQCAADRLFLVTGKRAPFAITRNGHEHLAALQRARRGAILLGAHLGSFEAMHTQAGAERLVINVVGYFRNAQMINRVLEELGSDVHARLLEPGSGIDFALRLRDCLERGEFVAILADRTIDEKTVEVDFLGGRAQFPTGPFVLAAALHCPVLLTFGLYHAPNRYDLYCEPFAEKLALPRANREEALREAVQRYATRLEHYCRLAPYNWFNFYDFWSPRA